MPIPHKHAALIKQWADDPSQDIWAWISSADLYRKPGWWERADLPPRWCEDCTYALGPKPTQPPRKMCTLAGVEFPMPVDDASKLVEGVEYFIANAFGLAGYWVVYWRGGSADHPRFLAAGLIHYNKEDAQQHSRALLAANNQAIKEAK